MKDYRSDHIGGQKWYSSRFLLLWEGNGIQSVADPRVLEAMANMFQIIQMLIDWKSEAPD